MTHDGEKSKAAPPLPASARVVNRVFGILLIAVAITIAIVVWPPNWKQVALVVVMVAIGIDCIVASARNRWPYYASFYLP